MEASPWSSLKISRDSPVFLKVMRVSLSSDRRPRGGLCSGDGRPASGERESSVCARVCSTGALTFLLAMGRNDGVGQISGFYVGRLMVRLAKSRDLFVSSSWKTMRQSPP